MKKIKNVNELEVGKCYRQGGTIYYVQENGKRVGLDVISANASKYGSSVYPYAGDGLECIIEMLEIDKSEAIIEITKQEFANRLASIRRNINSQLDVFLLEVDALITEPKKVTINIDALHKGDNNIKDDLAMEKYKAMFEEMMLDIIKNAEIK